jgi:hypothetical protein
MESRVDTILKLTDGGQKVSGKGPIEDWAGYEVGAIVTVLIVQPQPAAGGPAGGDITLAVASGSTGWIARDATSWAATAKVRTPIALKEGAAVAYAHGMIEYAPGLIMPYDWTVHVVLEV